MGGKNSNGNSLVKQPTLADTVTECQGNLWLAAFDGIKPDDVLEIVQKTVQRAKAGDNGAVKIVLGMLGQAASAARPRTKEFPPSPSRRVAALDDDDEPAADDRVKVTRKNYSQVAIPDRLRLDRLALVRSLLTNGGAGVTLGEVRNSLEEDDLHCTLEEFEAIHAELFPPGEDWHRPI